MPLNRRWNITTPKVVGFAIGLAVGAFVVAGLVGLWGLAWAL